MANNGSIPSSSKTRSTRAPSRSISKTGAKKDYVAYRGGHGCGGLTGSAYYLYGCGSNPRMYPTETATTEGIRLTNETRPGCWLNIIPAGGLIMIPESSSGCTCGYPLQTSVVLIPKTALAQKGI